jgi:hypothetical protein
MPMTLSASLSLALLQAAPVPSATPAAAEPTPPALPPEPAPAPVAEAPPPEPAPAPATPADWYLPNAAPVVATDANGEPLPGPVDDAIKYRRLVFSNFYTLNLGLFPIPSGEMSFFLGTNLRPRKSWLGKDWNTALGYQITLSLGYADANLGNSQVVQDKRGDTSDFGTDFGPLFWHRHALMAQGYGGRKGRMYYAMGGGVVMWNTLLVGVEGEGKLGYIFSAKEGARTRGVVGGQLRLGGPFDGYPLPQFGLFIGLMVF